MLFAWGGPGWGPTQTLPTFGEGFLAVTFFAFYDSLASRASPNHEFVTKNLFYRRNVLVSTIFEACRRKNVLFGTIFEAWRRKNVLFGTIFEAWESKNVLFGTIFEAWESKNVLFITIFEAWESKNVPFSRLYRDKTVRRP